jgi:ribosomal protein S6
LPEQGRRKYATTDGARTTWDARFHTVTFDVAPKGLTTLQRVLSVDEGILKLVTFKYKGALGRVHAVNYKNPYHSAVDTTVKPLA